MLENFPTEPRSTQEPQIFLPLALGGKRPFYINRPLYRYVKRENSSITSLVDYSKSMDYLRRREDITAKTIKAITPVNGALLKAHSLLTWHILLSAYKEYDEPEQAGRLAGLINQSGLIERKIDTNAVAQSGFESMARFFGNRVIGYNPPKTDIERKSGGRIIAYAAYGKALHQIRHGLLRSDIRPDVFWDIAAKPGDSIDGIPVIEPDFESLSPNDTCLVLLKDTLLAETVLNGFASKLLEENVWLYYEVLDYLSQYFYCTERAAEVAGI
jgi:hypothetical protein